MSMPGIGVMLSEMGGNEESVKALHAALGKEITNIELVESEEIRFTFPDGSAIGLYDNGQSCCESRYMVCDDDLQQFIGGSIVSAEIADALPVDTEYGCHDVEFLRIHTTKGVIVVSNHNEHNGYYGGFSIRVRKR